LQEKQPDVILFVGADPEAVARLMAIYRFDLVLMKMQMAYTPQEQKTVYITSTDPEVDASQVVFSGDLRLTEDQTSTILETFQEMMKTRVFTLAA
jgi:hypothetical protein